MIDIVIQVVFPSHPSVFGAARSIIANKNYEK